MKFIYLGIILLLFTSCIEIYDDITIKSDGTGTFKYNINLSSSKVKVNSILALDSLDGKKVPSIKDIQAKINTYSQKLSEKEGISNVKIESNFTDFIVKFQCDFKSIEALQKAIKEVIIDESGTKDSKEIDHNWLEWDGIKLVRSIPKITTQYTEKLKTEDSELLKNGSYVSISRFDRNVEKFDNSNAQLSANKMAVMLRANAHSLTQNTSLLENTIYLTNQKKP
jgi:hypothetical protein